LGGGATADRNWAVGPTDEESTMTIVGGDETFDVAIEYYNRVTSAYESGSILIDPGGSDQYFPGLFTAVHK
jgi:hypothetical protein